MATDTSNESAISEEGNVNKYEGYYTQLSWGGATPDRIRIWAKEQQAKENVIAHMQTLPVLDQLKAFNLALTPKTQLHQFFAVQRGSAQTSMSRGSFKIISDLRDGLKEKIIDHIESLEDPDEKLKMIDECLKKGTELNNLFITRRNSFFSYLFKTCENGSTIQKLKAMKEKVTIDAHSLSKPNPLLERLNAIQYKGEVPENLCCPLTFEIFIEPVKLASKTPDGKNIYCERYILKSILEKSSGTTFRCPITQQELQKKGALAIDKDKQTECNNFVTTEEGKARPTPKA